MPPIKNIWEWVASRGMLPHAKGENRVTRLFNQMSFLSGVSAFMILLIAILFQANLLYIIVPSIVVIFYTTTIYLNAINKIYWARMLISIFSPMWIVLGELLVGGNFSQSIGIGASIGITFIGFHKKPKLRNWLLTYNIGSFTLALLYRSFYPPLIGYELDYPLDEVIVFLMSLGWIAASVYVTVKNREKLIESLSEKNVQLQNTSEELERFTYIASHDMKSPLRTIISFLGLMERNLKKEQYDSLQQHLEFVKTGAQQMNFLITDILELSRVSQGDKSQRKWVDLNDVFHKAISNLMGDISEKNVSVEATPFPQFYCNEVEFLMLFQNFIQNGIKYNDSELPVIRVKHVEMDGYLKLIFEDNGIGIKEEYFDQIFHFFKRLHTSDKYQGTGLGLGLCKKLVTNYDGNIIVSSEVGKGSVFTLVFPIEEEYQEKETDALELVEN